MALGQFSQNTTLVAPLEIHSNPKDPVPENKSRTFKLLILFFKYLECIKTLKIDIIQICKKALGVEKIVICDSFFNIFTSGSGAIPHAHIAPQDKHFSLSYNKYTLVYYLDIGDQDAKDPGILKLYKPDEEILPTKGMIIIVDASRKHSVSYLGNKDRVMVGVNFYGF